MPETIPSESKQRDEKTVRLHGVAVKSSVAKRYLEQQAENIRHKTAHPSTPEQQPLDSDSVRSEPIPWPDFVVRYKALVKLLPNPEMARHYSQRTELANRIRAAHPDAEDHQLYDLLIGGSGIRSLTADFPGEYSIKAFMERFTAEHAD